MKKDGFVAAGVTVNSAWVDVTITLKVNGSVVRSVLTHSTNNQVVYTQPIKVSQNNVITVEATSTAGYTRYLTVIE